MRRTARLLSILLGSVLVFASSCEKGGSSGGSDNSSGTSSTQTLTSDFTPATGQGTPPAQTQGDEATCTGPWLNSIRLATSTDGLTFNDIGVHVADQAGVPCALIDPQGRLRIYYNAWQGDTANQMEACAVQQNGQWVYKKVEITSGLHAYRDRGYSDAHVVLLPDGRYRMYYMEMGSANNLAIHCAVSDDGFSFTYEQLAYEAIGEHTINVTVLQVGNEWLMWCGDLAAHYARSQDGLNFVRETWTLGTWFPFSGCEISGGWRIYGSSAKGTLGSAVSSDGVTWTLESGDRFPLGKTNCGPGENGLTPTSGGYLMVYNELIP